MTIEIDKQAQTVVFRTGENAEHRYSSGDIIGESYKLIDLIGQGGMGVVYRVQHLILDRQFALKLLAPAQINNLSWRRFELEGRSLAKLNHANIVSIYNMGVDRGCPYFVMDWLDGVSLAERIDE
jgi:serine/threonine-protein kinase